MASGKDSPQYKIVKENLKHIVTTLKCNTAAHDTLKISMKSEGWVAIYDNPTADNLVPIILNRIELEAGNYDVFMRMLRDTDGMDQIAKKLQLRQYYSGGSQGYVPPQQPVPHYSLYPPGQPWPYQGGPMPAVHPPALSQPYIQQTPIATSQLTAPPQPAGPVPANVRSTTTACPTTHTPGGRVVQKLKRGDRPNLSTINKFPHPSGDINILEQATPKYRQLGNILLNSSNGVRVQAIELSNNSRMDSVVYDIFQKWLVEDSDATWGKLVQCLMQAVLTSLAQDIDSCLE